MPARTVTPERARVRRSLPLAHMGAWSVLIGLLAYVVTVVAAAAITPGYSHVSQLISELGAVGAPASGAMRNMLIGVGLATLAFAAALGRFAPLDTRLGRGLLATLGASLVLGGVFQCDPRCEPTTFAGWSHLLTAVPGALASWIAPFAFARQMSRVGWRRRAWLSGGLGALAVLANILLLTVAPLVECVGLGQRAATIVPLAFMGLLAVSVLRPPPEQKRAIFPDGPRGLDILARVRDRRRPLEMLRQLQRDHGGIVGVRLPGVRIVVVTDAALMDELFVRNASRIAQWGMSQFEPVIGRGLLTSEGALWRRQRRLMQPLFLKARVPTYGPKIAHIAERMVDGMVEGQTIEAHAMSVRVATQVANTLLFSGDSEAIARVFEQTQHHLMLHFERAVTGIPLPLRVPTPANLRLLRSVRRLDVAIREIIAARRAAPVETDDLLANLIASGIDDTLIRDECVTMLLAASETTGTALAWTLHLLAQHPEVAERLSLAIDSVVGEETPTAEHLTQLPEVGHALRESMRIYTPVWGIGRVAVEELTLGEYTIPAGAQIFALPLFAHRDARTFSDPMEFRPERWQCPHAAARSAYRPFGSGPRKCIGEHLGMLELGILLVSLLRRFRLTPVTEGVDPRELATVSLRPRDGIYVRLERRNALDI